MKKYSNPATAVLAKQVYIRSLKPFAMNLPFKEHVPHNNPTISCNAHNALFAKGSHAVPKQQGWDYVSAAHKCTTLHTHDIH